MNPTEEVKVYPLVSYHELPTELAPPEESLIAPTADTDAPFAYRSKLWWVRAFLCTLVALYLAGVIGINVWVNVPNRRTVHIYGDSLVWHACDYYHLAYHLGNDLYYNKQAYRPEVTSWGYSLYRIGDLRNALHQHALRRFDYSTIFTWKLTQPPDAVILYWDSDVNPGPRDGSSAMANSSISRYLMDLNWVIEKLQANCKVVILAGPTLTGELPRGQNPLDAQLDYYTNLNQQTAARYNITFINTRDWYFANLPAGWNHFSGWLTVDGEHPNRRGSTMLRTVFRKALLAAEELW